MLGATVATAAVRTGGACIIICNRHNGRASNRRWSELAAQYRRVLERRQDLLRGLRPVIGILLETTHDESGQGGGNIGSQLGQLWRLLGQVSREQCVWCATMEWSLASKRLVCRDAERVDVDAIVRARVRGDLLRCHVSRRAERCAGGGQRSLRCESGGSTCDVECLRDTEVGDDRGAGVMSR